MIDRSIKVIDRDLDGHSDGIRGFIMLYPELDSEIKCVWKQIQMKSGNRKADYFLKRFCEITTHYVKNGAAENTSRLIIPQNNEDNYNAGLQKWLIADDQAFGKIYAITGRLDQNYLKDGQSLPVCVIFKIQKGDELTENDAFILSERLKGPFCCNHTLTVCSTQGVQRVQRWKRPTKEALKRFDFYGIYGRV